MVHGDEYLNRTLHRESKEEIHAFGNEPSRLTAMTTIYYRVRHKASNGQLILLWREAGIV